MAKAKSRKTAAEQQEPKATVETVGYRTITIEIPVSVEAHQKTSGPMHIPVKLTRHRRLRRAANALLAGLDDTGVRLDNGFRARFHTEAIKWLLGQIADKMEENTSDEGAA